MFITETWFDESSDANIENFEVFRRDRGSRGGGIAIYIRSNLRSSEISDDALSGKLNRTIAEQLWLSLDFEGTSVLIGCIYRPEKSTSERARSSSDYLPASIKSGH